MPESHPNSAYAPRRLWIRPAFWILLCLLLLAEGIARWSGPGVPTCTESRRNIYRYRGWPEYIEGIRDLPDSTRTVVFLSNCQGYGAEYPAKLGAASELGQELRRRGWQGTQDWEVLNWSLDGATSIEYTILAATLQEMKPDVIIASMAFADFRAEHFDAGYRYCRSDVPRLATRPLVLRHLPEGFLRRHAKVEDALAAAALDRLALLRVKEYIWSWLEGHFRGAHYALYAPSVNYRPWQIPKLEPWVPQLRPIGLPRDQDLDLLYDERSTAMLDELVGVLAASELPVVLVTQPFRDAHYYADRFNVELGEAATAHGLPHWDLHDAIPSGKFKTSNHLTRRGHLLFAEELANRLEGLQAPGEGER